MSANVTVLKDELGLQREYREVKRVASVGERVKYVCSGEPSRVDVVTEVRADGSVGVAPFYDEVYGEEYCGYTPEAYVVLEPTDIIRIDGERFRMIEHKADVGDLVVITNAVDDSFGSYGYKNGQIYEVVSMLIDEPFIRPDGSEDSEIYLEHWEYRVLEKIAEPDAQQAHIDGLTETVANLARRLAKVETQLRVAREDIVLIEEGVSEDIRKLEARVTELEQSSSTHESRCGKGEQSNACGAEYIPPHKPLTRDEIVEKAKADVVKLLSIYSGGPTRLQFVINRDKRTVVALHYHRGRVVARGIAKCAPDDCFNIHIGKAIALRRALEFEVPTEYVNTPQPTEPRTGDVVHAVSYSGEKLFATELTRRAAEFDDLGSGKAFRHTHDRGWLGTGSMIIIDDSREGRHEEVSG